MKSDISGLTVEQTRVFELDAMPTRFIYMPMVINKIVEKYHSGIVPEQAPKVVPSLQFNGGEFVLGEKNFPINSFSIEERRFILSIVGTSYDADCFFEDFKKTVKDILGPPVNFYNPIIKVDQSSCFVTLDASIEKLFESSFVSFFKESLPSYAKLPGVQIDTYPFSVRIELNYKVTNPALIKSNITVGPKHLIIEKRLQTRPEENVYFVSSPFDTTTHLKLIKDIDSLLKKKILP